MNNFRPFYAISALAGSGKTYTLTSRYIALLAQGFAPERIMAITFTRKAAGEIFDRIVRRLAEAAMSEDSRRELEIALRDQLRDETYTLDAQKPAEWLMNIVTSMDDLRISTMDSFFGALVKAFAFELGLPPRQELLDGATLEAAREEALDHAFDMLGRDDEGRDAFREAFKIATSGKNRRVRPAIHEIIDRDHKVYIEEPVEEAWGNLQRIWPDRSAWWMVAPQNPGALAALIDSFMDRYVEGGGHPAVYKNAWRKIAEALKSADWDEGLKNKLPERLTEARHHLAKGFATISFSGNDYTLSGTDAGDALAMIAAAVKGLIDRKLAETRGRWRLLDAYDRSFHSEMRQRGRMTFADVPLLLGRLCAEDVKLDIGYRMDSRIDHWMIDEFQDTNLRQWQIIGRLADEVLQSEEANRSFFYVGDVKQAIYGWRGGESNLFERVRTFYEKKFEAAGQLATSWRSSPVVLDFVNDVFGAVDSPGLLASKFPKLVAKWQEHWQEHHAAPKNRDLPGRVEWHNIEAKQEVDGLPGRIFLTVQLVRQLLDTGLNDLCVLVRTNAYGDKIAKALRARSIPVRRETRPKLLDNPAVSGLLSMFVFAEHPDDPFAWSHLEMTPLRDVLFAWSDLPPDKSSQHRLASRLREAAARRGIAGLLGEVIDACRQRGLLLDDFTGLRMRQLLDAAADYDRQVANGTARFAQWAADLDATDPGADGRVVVMTMHMAKGLEFDAVVLPELQGSTGQWDSASPGELKMGGDEQNAHGSPAELADHDARWVFPSPKNDLAKMDEQLADFSQHIKARRAQDEMCLFYVAMTRAKQYLYLVTEELPKEGEELNAARFLSDTITSQSADLVEHVAGLPSVLRYAAGEVVCSVGKEEQSGAHTGAKASSAFTPAPATSVGLRRLMMRTPSGEEKTEAFKSARLLFGVGKNSASARGTALHDLFSRVEWHEASAAQRAVDDYAADHGACPEEIRDEFLAAMAAPAIAEAMSKPSGGAEAWREQAFEFTDGETWVSGRMDRVVVERDAQGNFTRAGIIDFKSDRLATDENPEVLRERYLPQIDLYRKVLSKLTGLPENKVTAALILTATGQVLTV